MPDNNDRFAAGGPGNNPAFNDPDFFPTFPRGGSNNQMVIQPLNQNNNDVLISPSIMPEYIGGIEELFRYLGENISFPIKAKYDGLSAKVLVGFIVEKDGSVSNIHTIRCNTLNYGFEEEAMRVISNMPKWKPGMQSGRPVRVQFNIPIHFELR